MLPGRASLDTREAITSRTDGTAHTAAQDDFEELKKIALEDVQRKGFKGRLKSIGSKAKLSDLDRSQHTLEQPKDRERQMSLVRRVMETGGGDNEVLARKIHARFDAVGLKQPSVQVRFDHLTLSNAIPEGSGDSLFTVATDFKYKALGAIATAARLKPPMTEVKALNDVSGVLQPGRITLLLGPPGCGKSLLMKALANSAPLARSGEITYNGHTFDEFNVTRTARYVDQQDVHNPALTVRETLDFSARCQGAGYNRSLINELERREAERGISPDPDVAKLMRHMTDLDVNINTELVLQLMALKSCADTVVGDGMLRGISGGEKKRVTTAEMLVGPSKVLLMDEITTGLDSASAFTIVQSLANWAHATDSTILVALLQPEPQVYDLFDDVMVLAAGRMLYHGPRTEAPGYFTGLGFECPPHKAMADFLQEIVSPKDQPGLRTDRSKFEPSVDFVPASAFAARFKASDIFARTRAILDTPYDRSTAHPAALLKSRYGVAGLDSLGALMWRDRVLLGRNRQAQVYRYIQMFILAAVCSTLFLRGEVARSDTFQGAANRFSAIFFSMAYMQFLGLAECADTLIRLPLFFKQRFNLFFPAWAFAVPPAVVRLPVIFLEVTFWSNVVYWIVGMEAEPGRFFTFWATLFMLQIYSSSLYRFMGSAIRAVVTGTSAAVIAMLVTFMGTGFVLLRPQIPSYWIWVYWLSPLQYALTGLANNEYSGDSYNVPFEGDPSMTVGEAFLDSYGVPTGNKFRWMAPLILFSWAIVLNLANIAALTFLPPPPMPPPPPPTEEADWQLSEADSASAASDSFPESDVKADGKRNSGDNAVAVTVLPLPPTKPASTMRDKVERKPGSPGGLPFEAMTLAFNDVHYYVPHPAGHGELELLKGISGVFRPGVLTALMGASGAGKTTLMDVLADRKTGGRITGDVTVNGHAKDAATFARISGYCEQFDVHSAGATVEEAVRFSAALRLPAEIDEATREGIVQHTMQIVELENVAGAMVGMPGMGLSGEQFKRLTIAVELVANPRIIFMDEPTSGLDARAAQIVMRVVRNIVDDGRTIVCTIHQPSAEIFFAFDELLLLKRGGSTIYYGPIGEEGAELVSYFSSVRGVPPIKPQYNPATYMLEVSNASEEERLGIDFADLYRERQAADVEKRVQPFLRPEPGSKPITFDGRYATSSMTQYCAILTRMVRSYWRSPPYNSTRLILTVLAALILGSFYWSRGDNYGSTQDVLALSGALFISVMFVGLVNFQLVIPVFLFERPVFYRERAAGLYGVFPWATALVDVELPWVTAQTLIYSIIVYFMISFELDAGKFFIFWLTIWLASLVYTYLGMVMVSVTPNLTMGVTLGATMLGIWFIFAGFMIPRPAMPAWWEWMYYLSPPSWSIYALAADQLGDKENLIELENGEQTTIRDYMEDQYGYEYRLRWLAIGVLAAMVLIMRLTLAFALKYLNFQKR